ncbi:MAG: FAD-binding oxidoreductase [Herminiimonas sp.]|nr:FAD-binding oxidoreductase [Herminiimonas sp.]
MNSFWEDDVMLEADCIVVGGGLIGLLTALEWRDAHPADRIMLLERGFLPSGASSRNAGFACFGSLTELLSDIDTVGMTATVALVAQRWHGLARLRARLGDDAMGFEQFGGYELLTESQLPALADLAEINDALQPLLGDAVFINDAAGLAARGFGPQIHALVANRFEGQVHSGKLMRSLALLAGAQGIEIHTGATVEAIEDGVDQVSVRIAAVGHAEGRVCRAGKVALCTNALIGSLAPQLGIEPARGQVLVTEPIPDLAWRGCHHFDEGFYYFRNVGNRILLGGGRNRDFQGERTTEIAVTAPIQEVLQLMLEKIILPDRTVAVTHRWAGLMGFTVDKQPVVQKLSPHVAVGFGCNGMGVALGAEIATRTAALLA